MDPLKEGFYGRCYGKIRGRRIYIPSIFIRHIKTPFHVYACPKRYLRLISGNAMDSLENEDEIYLGSAQIDSHSFLHLEESMKNMIYSSTHDIVIVGAGEALEIWKRSAYMEEVLKDQEMYRAISQDLLK